MQRKNPKLNKKPISIKAVLRRTVTNKKIQTAMAVVIVGMVLTGCDGGEAGLLAIESPTATLPATADVTFSPTITPTTESTPTPTASPTVEPSPTSEFPTYEDCGIVTTHFPSDQDVYGHDRPTYYWGTRAFGPTTEALVVGCLADAIGKDTDPDDIVNGYENTVTFYDKYGKPHSYRLIVGGVRLSTLEGREEILAADGYTGYGASYDLSSYRDLLSRSFSKNRSNETGLYLYVSGGKGASAFYDKISQNSEIYQQVAEAIKTGEGFPEDLPENFYLYASMVVGPMLFH